MNDFTSELLFVQNFKVLRGWVFKQFKQRHTRLGGKSTAFRKLFLPYYAKQIRIERSILWKRKKESSISFLFVEVVRTYISLWLKTIENTELFCLPKYLLSLKNASQNFPLKNRAQLKTRSSKNNRVWRYWTKFPTFSALTILSLNN